MRASYFTRRRIVQVLIECAQVLGDGSRMSDLFIGRVVADELRGPTPRELVDILVAKEAFHGLVEVIDEGLKPKKANEMLRSAQGRAELFERACESYGALFEEDPRTSIQA
jgi:hypothetical protein